MSHALRIVSLSCLLLVVTMICSPAAMAGKKKPATAEDQLEFGVKMAQRGLWSEALFRFKQAERLDATDPMVFNNLAVASEALGRFDEALDYYRKALQLAPSDRGVRGNYSRFVEFYQSYKPDGGGDEASEGMKDEAAAQGSETPESEPGVPPVDAGDPATAAHPPSDQIDRPAVDPAGYGADSK